MAEGQWDKFSVHFAQYAGKLEQHLRRNGISCREADIIIEDSSALYFEKVQSAEASFFKLVKRHDPKRLFAESASKAIGRHLPEASNTFGSYSEITKCIRVT